MLARVLRSDLLLCEAFHTEPRVCFVCLFQVVEDCYNILKEYGFRFVKRGPIFVKGKGELLTYFLKGRDKQGSFINGSSVTLPHQVVDS